MTNFLNNRNIHRPPHLYLEKSTYFITAKTFNKVKYFNNDKRKELFIDVLKRSLRKFKIKIFAWVILDNHYHLLFHINNVLDLSKFIQNLHSNTSRIINKIDGEINRRIWYQYWDHSIRDEKDFWRHFNYIHHNPIKHQYVKKMKDYKFSSYNCWAEKRGEKWLDSCFELYPIIDFTPIDL